MSAVMKLMGPHEVPHVNAKGESDRYFRLNT